jgi:hypothetical protein
MSFYHFSEWETWKIMDLWNNPIWWRTDIYLKQKKVKQVFEHFFKWSSIA